MHRENIKKIANALTISENDIQYEDQYKSYTIDEKKEIIIKDEFGDIQIDIPVKFYKCHIKFNNDNLRKDININLEFYECKFINTKIISCNFNKQIYFKECEFLISEDKLDYINEIRISSKFLHSVDFSNTIFKDNVYFNNSIFEDYADFHECEFEKTASFYGVTFKKTPNFNKFKFKDNVYFNNSIFEDYADFHECEFEKTASFYGVTFKKTPNFSQAIFKSNLNIANANLNFDFDKLEAKIKQEHNNDNKKSLDKFANDFRDFFRGFKSALIKDNNLLDASEFHKYELYCKELELKHKGKKTLKDKIDYWQLVFYRKLCEHHTDLLLNLKWLAITIGLFACLYFIAKVFQNINILNILSPLGAFLSILSFLILLCMCYHKCIKTFDFFVYLSIIPILWVIFYKPKLIFGIANLIGDKNYNGFENALITIYTILLALVLFSLQKTARKNSIVPN